MLAYLFACSVAHHAALLRTKSFAATNNIPIDRIAALPLPPSLLDWGGVIRTTDGVYQSRFDLRDSAASGIRIQRRFAAERLRRARLAASRGAALLVLSRDFR